MPPTCLMTDASDTAVGAVLQQNINGKWNPISFFSKKTTPAETVPLTVPLLTENSAIHQTVSTLPSSNRPQTSDVRTERSLRSTFTTTSTAPRFYRLDNQTRQYNVALSRIEPPLWLRPKHKPLTHKSVHSPSSTLVVEPVALPDSTDPLYCIGTQRPLVP